jgi:hypothetical protein
MTPQQQHKHLAQATEKLDRQQILDILAPLTEEEVKYQYEQRLLEHRLGSPSSIATM